MSDEETAAPTRLYVVYLGGDQPPGRLGEDHEVVLVVASDVKEARRAARAKWSGHSSGHVDAVQTIDVVDGFEIQLLPTERVSANEMDTTYVDDESADD